MEVESFAIENIAFLPLLQENSRVDLVISSIDSTKDQTNNDNNLITENNENDKPAPNLVHQLINTGPTVSKRKNSFTLPTKSSESRSLSTGRNITQTSALPVKSDSARGIALKTTIPISPRLRTSSRMRGMATGSNKVLTSEEKEIVDMEASIKAQKEHQSRMRQMYERNKAKLASQPPASVFRTHSTKEPTIPTTPIHNMTNRFGKKEIEPVSTSLSSSLENKDSSMPKKPTIPEPFKFQTDLRASQNSTHSHTDDPVTPMATTGEATQNFIKDMRSIHVSDQACKKLTVGEAPVFRTEQRSLSRPKPRPKSLEEIEAEIMERMKTLQFKAKPVDKRILQEPVVPVRVPVKPATAVEPFSSNTERRAAEHDTSNPTPDAVDTTSFKALPMPDFARYPQQTKAVQHVATSHKRLTVPESPKLGGKYRASSAPHARQLPHHTEQEKQREAAKNTKVDSAPLKLTEPREFKLRSDDRGLMYQSLLDEDTKRKLKEDEKMKTYKAKPVPETVFRKPFVPQPSTKELTDTQSFQLSSLQRHLTSEQKWMQSQKDSEATRAKLASFHAMPIPQTTYQAQKPPPVVNQKDLVTPVEVHFESDERVRMRKLYTQKMEEKARLEAEAKAAKDRQELAVKEKELHHLRMKPVSEGGYQFIAQPVVTQDMYPSRQVRSIPLTEPKTPQFLTDKRAMLRDL